MARGGYRPGAGRPKGSKTKNKAKPKATTSRKAKPKPKKQPAAKRPAIPADIIQDAAVEGLDPLTYMLTVMNTKGAADERRDRMAIAAAPFVHARKGEGAGKKQDKTDRAKAAGAGKFRPVAPPILKAVK